MLQALAEYRIVGVANNVEFLSRLVACPAFARADLDTGLIERERAFLFPQDADAPDDAYLVAALATLLREEERARETADPGGDRYSPWRRRTAGASIQRAERRLVFRHGEVRAHRRRRLRAATATSCSLDGDHGSRRAASSGRTARCA